MHFCSSYLITLGSIGICSYAPVKEYANLEIRSFFVILEVGWLCWGLTSQSTIFQSCRDGAIASWVINQYFRGVKCLAQGHNTAAVGLEPRTSRSGVRHSTTEPPRSPHTGGALIATGSLSGCPVLYSFKLYDVCCYMRDHTVSLQENCRTVWQNGQIFVVYSRKFQSVWQMSCKCNTPKDFA